MRDAYLGGMWAWARVMSARGGSRASGYARGPRTS